MIKNKNKLILLIIILLIIILVIFLYIKNKKYINDTDTNTIENSLNETIKNNEINNNVSAENYIGSIDANNSYASNNTTKYLYAKEESEIGLQDDIMETQMERIQIDMEYFAIERIIKNFYELIKLDNSEQILIDMLNSKYISEYNLNQNNVKEHVKNFNYEKYEIVDMYGKQLNNNIKVFLIYGNLENNDYNFMIIFDLDNNCFSMYLDDYVKNHKYEKNNIENLTFEEDRILLNNNNQIKYKSTSSQELAIQYFNDMKSKFLSNLQETYNSLDANFKQKNFPDYEKFESFFNQNKEMFENIELKKYIEEYKDNVRQYKFLDNYDNYYLLKLESAMKYTLMFKKYDT